MDPCLYFSYALNSGKISYDFSNYPDPEDAENLIGRIVLAEILKLKQANFTSVQVIASLACDRKAAIVLDLKANYQATLMVQGPELVLVHDIKMLIELFMSEFSQELLNEREDDNYVNFECGIYETIPIPEDLKPTTESTKEKPLTEPIQVPLERVEKVIYPSSLKMHFSVFAFCTLFILLQPAIGPAISDFRKINRAQNALT